MIVFLLVFRRSAALREQSHRGDGRGCRFGSGERNSIGLHGPGDSQLRAPCKITQRLGYSDDGQWSDTHMLRPLNRYRAILPLCMSISFNNVAFYFICDLCDVYSFAKRYSHIRFSRKASIALSGRNCKLLLKDLRDNRLRQQLK